jgi:polar amino acid transport system substrate-binding protein
MQPEISSTRKWKWRAGSRNFTCLIAGIACCAIAVLGPASGPAAAQPSSPAIAAAQVPGFWDPRRRPERPDLSRLSVIRFLTETDYPPFNFAGPDNTPRGFNVDIARMICEEINVPCTIQMRRFDTLIDSVNRNRGDAIIASIGVNAKTRGRVDFSDPYYRAPARFVARKDATIMDVRPEKLEGRKIAVIANSAHEAFLRTQFTEAEVRPYPNADGARAALRAGEVDLLFGDGIALAFWLNGTSSESCCEFRGGPYFDSQHFGEGIGIAVRKGNDVLRQAINWALFRIWESGRFADLWLRYFPISPF